MTYSWNRREWMSVSIASSTALLLRPVRGSRAGSVDFEPDGRRLSRETLDFIVRCHRPDGGYAPSPDPNYAGTSDTGFSDLAAVTYATVLARTMGWELPDPKRSVEFIARHQQADGRFVNLAGKHDPKSDLGVLYNTTQGVVALRALGARPGVDPLPVVGRMLEGEGYRKLPWYTTSFFPLVCAALDKPFPDDWRRKLSGYMEENQAADGYLGDHVAATFHMAHFYRLIGQPTPKADKMVAR